MREELTSIKNTQSLVQHQLGDLREYLEKNQAKGGITSEALQPIYELKHVAERSSKSSEEVLAKLSTLTQVSSCSPPPVCHPLCVSHRKECFIERIKHSLRCNKALFVGNKAQLLTCLSIG
ncbi:uncharacterized protein [Dysidea avara]|uniref:uncharacterized protein n=1 Tax=Dysidea avara TaxID=196820 RepID=UPI00332891F6